MIRAYSTLRPLRQESFDRLLPEDFDLPESPEQLDDEPEPCSWEDQPSNFDGT